MKMFSTLLKTHWRLRTTLAFKLTTLYFLLLDRTWEWNGISSRDFISIQGNTEFIHGRNSASFIPLRYKLEN